MRSKFVPPPEHQASRDRPQMPPANVLSEAAIAKTILSFQKGLGAGPSGLRPDLLKQIIGPKGGRPGIVPFTFFCNLLADGRAPIGVQPYMGGANGFAFEKESKTNEAELSEARSGAVVPDARLVCSGELWRRIISKAMLASEKCALLDYLKPYQLAVAVPSGAEVMPHLA